MEHADALRKLAADTKYTEYELRKLFQRYAFYVREALVSGQDVHINGVGKLRNLLCKPRLGRNPRTGERVHIPERRRVKFKTCLQLEIAMRAAANPLKTDPIEQFGITKIKETPDGKVRRRTRSPKGKDGG